MKAEIAKKQVQWQPLGPRESVPGRNNLGSLLPTLQGWDAPLWGRGCSGPGYGRALGRGARAGAQEAACWPAEHPAGELLRVPCTLETAEQTTTTREEALYSPSLAVPPAPSVDKV